jgi:hypothetical protein
MASDGASAHNHPMRKSILQLGSLLWLLSMALGSSGCWGLHRHDDYDHHDDRRDDHHDDRHDDHHDDRR